jgi:hypothetical protein
VEAGGMTANDDLMAWLGAQLDADETSTQRLLDQAREIKLELKEPAHLGQIRPGWGLWPGVERMAAGVLADIAAKRRVVDLHQPVVSVDGVVCVTCREPDYPDETAWLHPCPTLRELGSVYADSPGYREKWGAHLSHLVHARGVYREERGSR